MKSNIINPEELKGSLRDVVSLFKDDPINSYIRNEIFK